MMYRIMGRVGEVGNVPPEGYGGQLLICRR
jgi:hypothetical protein